MIRALSILLLSVSCLCGQGVFETLLSIPQVADAGGGGSPASSLVTNLVAYWRLDEASDSVRYDSVGANNLADNGGVPSITGYITNAALFRSNQTEYLSIADTDDLSVGGGSFTVAFMFKPYVTNVQEYLTGKMASSPNREYYIQIASSGVGFVYYTNGTTLISTTITEAARRTTNEWHHVVAVLDADGGKAYLVADMLNFATSSIAIPFTGGTASGFALGSRPATTTGRFTGEMDEVAIWKRALSWQEITNLNENLNAGRSYPWTGQP